MRIAAFNGFPFHDEMFGFIIYFCQLHNYELTIYCRTDVYNDYMDFYKFHFKDFKFTIYDCKLFTLQRYNFDYIFLITDDDPNYSDTDPFINFKTIRLDHSPQIRRDKIEKAIAVRPFPDNYRKWAIPCFPILYSNLKCNLINSLDEIHIVILGSNHGRYNVSVINRIIPPKDSKIIIHAISRSITEDDFVGLDCKFNLCIYKNIFATNLINLLKKAHYALTDISLDTYEKEIMSGVIPLAFSTLTPLIISAQSNKYYNFKNVIVFDKHSEDTIQLTHVNINELETERQYLMDMFRSYF